MRILLKTSFPVFLFLLLSIQVTGQSVTKSHKDSLNLSVTKYYDLNLKIFQSDSKVKDIDTIFELFTKDFEYVHPKYGGVYKRTDLYNGYIRNQKNGGYNGEVIDVKIINKIIGLNSVVVQRSYIENKNGIIKEGEPQMTLFEFQDGKISRIFEY